MVIRTDILVVPIFHSEAFRYCSELHKAQSFIQMSRMYVAFYNGVKLKHLKAVFAGFFQAIHYQFLSDVLSTAFCIYRIAGITDMSAPADVIRMQDIQTDDLTVIFRHAGITLRLKELFSRRFIKCIFLRKRCSFLNNIVPYVYHLPNVFFCIFPNDHRNAPSSIPSQKSRQLCQLLKYYIVILPIIQGEGSVSLL